MNFSPDSIEGGRGQKSPLKVEVKNCSSQIPKFRDESFNFKLNKLMCVKENQRICLPAYPLYKRS